MKVLGYILTAAALLIGADVFVKSYDPAAQQAPATTNEQPLMSLHGGNGIPPPPTD